MTALIALITGSAASAKPPTDCARAVFRPTPCKAPIVATFDVNMGGRGLSAGETNLVKLTVVTHFKRFHFVGSYVQTSTWTAARGYRIVAVYRRHPNSTGSAFVAERLRSGTRTGQVTVHEPRNAIYALTIEMVAG